MNLTTGQYKQLVRVLDMYGNPGNSHTLNTRQIQALAKRFHVSPAVGNPFIWVETGGE